MASWAATETTLRRLARPGNTHRGAGAFQRGERRQLMTAPRCRTAWGSSSRTAEGARVCCCVRAQVPTACAKVRHGEPGLLCQASANSSGALTWHNGHMDALTDPAPPAKLPHQSERSVLRAALSLYDQGWMTRAHTTVPNGLPQQATRAPELLAFVQCFYGRPSGYCW